MAKKKTNQFIGNTEISIIEASLIAQESRFEEVRSELFSDLVRAHIELKFHNPSAVIGKSVYFKLLEFYGKISITDAQKAAIMKDVIQEFPGAELEWRKERCQLVAYNNYLVTVGKMDERQNNPES